MNKKLISVLLIVCPFILSGCGKTTVSLDKYFTINVDGYNSRGMVTPDFDLDAFSNDYYGKIKDSRGDIIDPEELFMECVDGKADKMSELSNGDVITWKWECRDAKAEEDYKVKLDYSDILYTVEGLDELGVFEPFDYINVSFAGISPNGSVIIEEESREEFKYINVLADKESELKNGDTITLSASIPIDSEEEFVDKFGMILGETKKKYTVEGLSHYITDISELPPDMFEKMDKRLQEDLSACFAKWNASDQSLFGDERFEKLVDMNLVGNYTLTAKEGSRVIPNNIIYFIYKVTATNDVADGNFDYYWFGQFKDILILEDGTCSVDLGAYRTSEDGNAEYLKFSDRYHYYGYYDLDSMFNRLVVTNSDKYDYKEDIKE